MRTILISSCLLALYFVSGEAFALKCGNDLATEGDRKLEVLQKCGEPLLIEEWGEEAVVYVEGSDDARIKRVESSRFEEWTYNFGPTRFVYFLTFKDGRVTHIEHGPKGFNEIVLLDSDKARCGDLIAIGDKKIEVIMKCGEPALKDSHREEISDSIKDKKDGTFVRYKRFISKEEWSYNYGPGRFLYFIEFENGEVVKIDHGDHGF